MDATLTIEGEAKAAGITQFESEACIGTVVMGSEYKGSKLTRPQADIQNITDYFERPRLFARGSVAFASRASIFTSDIGYTFLTTNFPQWANRLSGVYGIRFTLVFRVQFAATAFHQGVIALAYQHNSSSSTTLTYNRGSNPATATNLPHVRGDLSEVTMIELKVPFLWQYEFLPVSATPMSSTGIIGNLTMTSLLPPITVTGSTAPSYEAYVYLEDIQLFGADNNATTAITLQGGKRVGVREQEDAHVFSNAFTATSKAVSFVGKHIPLLSSIADTTSWVLDTAAGIARFFGYARPLVQDPVIRVQMSPYVGEGNVDNIGVGYMLGPFQSNTLATDANFSATDVDEMALAYVLKQWGQICVGQVAVSDTHNKVIYAMNVSPQNMWFRAPSVAPYCNIPPPLFINATNNSFLPSHLFFWSSMFRQWRGTIKYRFTFAKTKFHGGRYMVSYNPNETPNYYSTSLSALGPEVVSSLVQPYGYSAIFDLKDGNVFEFDVPWLCASPYLMMGGHTGSISMVCIDPLQANVAVASTVQFMVEVCAGDDFELAIYRGLTYYPMVNGTPTLQSGKVVSATNEPAQYVIGERITSAKQLISIPHYTSGTVSAGSSSTVNCFPWWYYRTLPATSPLPIATKFNGLGRVSGAIAQCYVYARGSTDYHVYTTVGDNVTLTAQYGGSDGGVAQTGLTYPSWDTSTVPKVIATQRAPLHIRVPAFQSLCRIPTWLLGGVQWIFDLSSTPAIAQPTGPFSNIWSAIPKINVVNSSTVATAIISSTAAGDDAQLGVYIGPVPLVVPQSTQTAGLAPDWSTL